MHLPFETPRQQPVLVAGCGGGYDVVCALPVALELKKRGVKVALTSYSFTEIPGDQLYQVNPDDPPTPPSTYFPESWLCRWWRKTFNEDVSLWCYRRIGVVGLAEIFKSLGFKTLVMVDAGVDGLFWGNEHDLGTPSTDAISILAAYSCPEIESYYAFCAFGSEGTGQEVRHADALQRIAEQQILGGMLGVSSLLRHSEVGEQFIDCVDYIHRHLAPQWHSNMASSIRSAMFGSFGFQNLTVKTDVAPIWVSPLTNLYWFFQLRTIAEAKPYLNEGLKTTTVGEMHNVIEAVRDKLGVLPRRDIPI